MKATITMLLALLFIGCTEKEVVYVDANGTAMAQPKRFETITPPIVCDTRGYAFYKNKGYGFADYSLVPIMHNGTYGTYQDKCEEIK